MRYCDEFAALLDLYVDGELSPEEMARVQAHLGACPGCQAYVDDALAIRAAFPAPEETEVPEGFSDGVMAVIQAEAVPQRKRKSPWLKAALPLAACLAIVVLVQNRPTESFHTAADTAASASMAIVETETAVEEEAAAAADTASGALEARDIAPQEASEDCSQAKQADGVPVPSETQDAPMAYTAATTQAPGMTNFAAETPAAESASYLAVLTVAERDVDSLLDGFTPTEETAETVRYELNTADYEALLTALSEGGAAWEETVGTADAETALVIVTRS